MTVICNSSLVSIIIPTYYRNKRVVEAISSVAEQTYAPIECIVVDSSGSGHAKNAVQDLDLDLSRLVYRQPMEQLNMNSALNRGLKETRGSYVQFLDDDDKIKPDKIERQVNLLESSPEVGMVYSGFETESGKEYYPSPEVRGPVLKYALQFGVSTWKTSTWLVDRDIVRKITPFDEELVASTDLKKLIKMAQHTHFDYIDDLLVIQGDPEEETRLGDSAEAIEGRMQILDEFRHLYTKFDNSVYDSARSETYYLRGMQEFDKNIWSKIAILSFARAVYHSPSVNPNLIATLAASMFGRPGLSYARKLKELTL